MNKYTEIEIEISESLDKEKLEKLEILLKDFISDLKLDDKLDINTKTTICYNVTNKEYDMLTKVGKNKNSKKQENKSIFGCNKKSMF